MADHFQLPGQVFVTSGPTSREPDPAHSAADLFYALRSHWWIILGAGLLAATIAALTMARRDPVYSAEALLQKTGTSPLSVAGLVLARDEVAEDIASQVEVIRSRTVLSPVVDSLGLELTFIDQPERQSTVLAGWSVEPAVQPGRYQLSAEEGRVALRRVDAEAVLASARPGEALRGPGFSLTVRSIAEMAQEPLTFQVVPRDRALDALRRELQVEAGLGPDLIEIRYTSPDPVRAAAVVNLAAEAYRDFRTRSVAAAARSQRQFLAVQIAQVQDSLRRVQEDLLRYQEQQRLISPDAEAGSLAVRLIQAEEELRQMRFEEGQLSNLVSASRANARSTVGLQRVMATGRQVLPGGDELYRRLQELETERNRLTASRFGYTDANPEVQVIDSLMAVTRRQIRVLAEQTLALQRERGQALAQQAGTLRQQVTEAPQKTADFTRLQQRVDAVQRTYDPLVAKYYEAQLAESVELGDVSIIDPARVPLRPAPNPPLNVVVAFVVGVLLSAGGIGLKHRLDVRIQRREDAERMTGLPVTGIIPRLPTDPQRSGEASLMGVEAFRLLAANLHFNLPQEHGALMVTSAAPGEGKSTVAVNLAMALADQGHRTILIDADFRRPVVHLALQLPQEPGFADVLLGRVPLQAAIQDEPHSGLAVLPSGAETSSASAVLGSVAFARVLAELRERYDYVIFDTAPLLAVTDSNLLCPQVDGLIFAVRADHSVRDAVARAIERARVWRAKSITVVLTDVPTDALSSRTRYGYYNYAGAYSPPRSFWGKRHRRVPRLLLPGK